MKPSARKRCPRSSFAGSIDASFAYNANRPLDHANLFPGTGTSAKRSNELALNLAQVDLVVEPTPVGFVLSLGFGNGTEVVHAGEPAGVATSPDAWRHVLQASMQWNTGLGRGLLVEAGVFPSHIGFESFASKDKVGLAKGYIRDPQVTVVVQEVRSKFVFVVGEVTKPETYVLAGDTKLVEVLAKAGPLSPEAGTEIVVVRPSTPVDRPILPQDVKTAGPKAAEVQRVDMRDIQAGQLEKNLSLRANDTVFVPKVSRIFVSGEVHNAGAFPFAPGLTSRQAISLAGGFTVEASTGSARVVRMVDGRSKTLKIKLDEPLLPGDTVVVKRRWF